MRILGGLDSLEWLQFGVVIIWAWSWALSYKPRINWTMVKPIWEKWQQRLKLSEPSQKSKKQKHGWYIKSIVHTRPHHTDTHTLRTLKLLFVNWMKLNGYVIRKAVLGWFNYIHGSLSRLLAVIHCLFFGAVVFNTFRYIRLHFIWHVKLKKSTRFADHIGISRVRHIIMTINLICGYIIGMQRVCVCVYNLVSHSIFGIPQLERTFG